VPSISIDILVRGEKSQIFTPNVRIDSQDCFTTLPSEIFLEIGASSESLKARLELEDGSSVEAPIFSVALTAQGREDPTLAITFDGAQEILGAKFLEDFGLRLNPESDELEPTGHWAFAFDVES